ncbi:unnamed protein product [Leuciscus chuanchicus]
MAPAFTAPEPFRPLPLAQWFETFHSNGILSHLDVPNWDQEDVKELKAAKRGEWKSSHGGQAPTESASISPGKMANHCRRRTRRAEEIRAMISGLLESVWELTDTTGFRLVNPDRERIAVEYLLAQSNRGDQLLAHHNDTPEVPPEEPKDDNEIDTTVCHAADLRADDSDLTVADVEAQVTSQVGDNGPKSPDEEVSEEQEDDTTSPSTSGQPTWLA